MYYISYGSYSLSAARISAARGCSQSVRILPRTSRGDRYQRMMATRFSTADPRA